MVGEHVGKKCPVVHSEDFNLFLFVLNLEVEEEEEGGGGRKRMEGGRGWRGGGRERGRKKGGRGTEEKREKEESTIKEEGREGDQAGSCMWTVPVYGQAT